MVSFCFVVRHQRLKWKRITIEFAVKALLLTKYEPPEWFVNMLLQVILELISIKKACLYKVNASAESGMFCRYRGKAIKPGTEHEGNGTN